MRTSKMVGKGSHDLKSYNTHLINNKGGHWPLSPPPRPWTWHGAADITLAIGFCYNELLRT